MGWMKLHYKRQPRWQGGNENGKLGMQQSRGRHITGQEGSRGGRDAGAVVASEYGGASLEVQQGTAFRAWLGSIAQYCGGWAWYPP